MLYRKTLIQAKRLPKGLLQIPRRTQDLIPVKRVYEDGVFEDAEGYFSKTFLLLDINYTELQDSEKEQSLINYSMLLNSIDKGARCKLTVAFRPIDEAQFERDVLLPTTPKDGLDDYRRAMNDVLLTQAQGSLGMQKRIFLTIAEQRKSYAEAASFFARLEGSIQNGVKQIRSEIEPVSLSERMRFLHDVYRPGLEHMYRFDPNAAKRTGMSFKDAIAPLAAEDLNSIDHLKLGGRYCRSLFLNEYPTYLDDRILSELSSVGKSMIISVDFEPIPLDEAKAEAESRAFAIETKIVSYNLRQQRNKNYSGMVPYNLTQQAESAKEVLRDIQERDQNLYLTTVTVTHFADSLKELDQDTDSIMSRGKSISCQFLPLTAQQLHGLNTVLPYGRPYIQADRLLTTQALAGICPFAAREVYHPGGSWLGRNATTKHLIVMNREVLPSGNAVVMAPTGTGKSFHIKEEAVQIILRGGADVIFLDPEGEYVPLTEALGGTVITLSMTSPHRMNPFDIDPEEEDRYTDKPFKEKLSFIWALCQGVMEENGSYLDGQLKSIIDRCAKRIFTPMIHSGYRKPAPLLNDLRLELLKQKEPRAQELALNLEMYTVGSFNMFSCPTNVDTAAHVVTYDLSRLSEYMRPFAEKVLPEYITERMTANFRKGIPTYVFCDEIIQFFENPASAQYFGRLSQRIRKRGGFLSGIFQNVSQVMENEEARKLVLNSLIVTMLSQSPTDLEMLADMFHLSDAQQQMLSQQRTGSGLIKIGSTIVSFENAFPTDNMLYKLMTTRPTDRWGQNEDQDV